MNHQAFNFENLRTDPRYAKFTASFGKQPSWVLKFAFLAAALVILVPIVVAVFTAIAMFFLVFLVLSLVNVAVRALGGLFSSSAAADTSPGRRNVRVIHPDGS